MEKESTMKELAQANDTVEAVTLAGSLLMQAGAEVYRVEDTMERLGLALPDVQECIPYVVTTGVFCSLVIHNITYTRIARIKQQNRNIYIINQINSLSRNAASSHMSASEVLERLHQIESSPVYSFWIKTIFGAIGAMGFAIFFGGGFWDIVAVFMIGLLVRGGTVVLERLTMIDFLSNTLLSLLAGTLSVLIAHYFPVTSQDTLIISSIMLLVPGLAIMNAIRDIMMGEYVSGVASLAQAMFCALAIAIGIVFSIYFGGWLARLPL